MFLHLVSAGPKSHGQVLQGREDARAGAWKQIDDKAIFKKAEFLKIVKCRYERMARALKRLRELSSLTNPKGGLQTKTTGQPRIPANSLNYSPALLSPQTIKAKPRM